MKLTDHNDIEAYLTYEVSRDRWVYKLAPQLFGRAQQAAMIPEEASEYEKVKAAILRRYEINEETYRRHFKTATKASDKAYRELAIRLQDLVKKWMCQQRGHHPRQGRKASSATTVAREGTLQLDAQVMPWCLVTVLQVSLACPYIRCERYFLGNDCSALCYSSSSTGLGSAPEHRSWSSIRALSWNSTLVCARVGVASTTSASLLSNCSISGKPLPKIADTGSPLATATWDTILLPPTFMRTSARGYGHHGPTPDQHFALNRSPLGH